MLLFKEKKYTNKLITLEIFPTVKKTEEVHLYPLRKHGLRDYVDIFKDMKLLQ